MDMSPYAVAMIRIFLKGNNQISVNKIHYKKNRNVKNFNVFCVNKDVSYFGNFGTESEYISEIRFFKE